MAAVTSNFRLAPQWQVTTARPACSPGAPPSTHKVTTACPWPGPARFSVGLAPALPGSASRPGPATPCSPIRGGVATPFYGFHFVSSGHIF